MSLFAKNPKKPIKESLIPYLFYCSTKEAGDEELVTLQKNGGYTREEIIEGLRAWGFNSISLFQESVPPPKDATSHGRLWEIIPGTPSGGKITARLVSPAELEEFNAMDGVEHLDVLLEDDYPRKKWSDISNPNFRTVILDAWEGSYKGLKLTAPNIETLELDRKVALFAKDGLLEMKKLKNATIRAYPRFPLQPLLEHPGIECATVDGMKETNLSVPVGSPLRSLKIGEWWPEMSKITSVTIPAGNSLEELEVASSLPFTIDSVTHLAKVRRLRLHRVVLDCAALSSLRTLENLELLSAKEILNIQYIAALPNLKKLYLWNCKKISDIEKLPDCSIAKLVIGSADAKVINQLLLHSHATDISISYGKGFVDLSLIKNIDQIETLTITACAVKNIEWLDQAIRLKEISITGAKERPVLDLSFVKKLPHLQHIELPAFPEQKKDLIKYFLSRDRVHPSFSDLTKAEGNEIEIETLEYYHDIEITKCTEQKRVTYGFRENVSEILKVHDNGDAEELIKKKLKKLKETRDFDFDSEADSFGASSLSLENIKWLIDFIYTLELK